MVLLGTYLDIWDFLFMRLHAEDLDHVQDQVFLLMQIPEVACNRIIALRMRSKKSI